MLVDELMSAKRRVMLRPITKIKAYSSPYLILSKKMKSKTKKKVTKARKGLR